MKTIITLSFDDGREDTYYNAYKILKKYNLPATIHVITGYVDGSYNSNIVSSKSPCTVEELTEMKNNGVEMSLHGDQHITELKDLSICEEKMKKWKLIDNNFGFSMPYSNEEKLKDKEFIKKMKKDLSYVRVGKNTYHLTLYNKAFYFLYLITDFNLFYNLYNRNNIIDLNKKVNKYYLTAVPVKKNDKLSTLKQFINKNINKNKWIIFMFHSIHKNDIDEYNESVWVWDINKFEEFCLYLSNLRDKENVEILSIIDVIKKV